METYIPLDWYRADTPIVQPITSHKKWLLDPRWSDDIIFVAPRIFIGSLKTIEAIKSRLFHDQFPHVETRNVHPNHQLTYSQLTCNVLGPYFLTHRPPTIAATFVRTAGPPSSRGALPDPERRPAQWTCHLGPTTLSHLELSQVPKLLGYPSWVVYFMENPIKMDDLGVLKFFWSPQLYPFITHLCVI